MAGSKSPRRAAEGHMVAGPRSPQKAAEEHRPHQAEQQLDHGVAVAGRRAAAPSEVRWVGEPSKDPPSGLSMHASHHRNFYSAVAKVSAPPCSNTLAIVHTSTCLPQWHQFMSSIELVQ